MGLKLLLYILLGENISLLCIRFGNINGVFYVCMGIWMANGKIGAENKNKNHEKIIALEYGANFLIY